MVTLNKLPDIQLAKDGYDPFIDFMKGFCILSVVLVHAIPHIPGGVYTIGQCVPLFLLIQVYHYYKNGMENAKPFNIQKVWKRILRLFLEFSCSSFQSMPLPIIILKHFRKWRLRF